MALHRLTGAGQAVTCRALPRWPQHDDAGTAELIRQEKRRMLADMWGLVRHRVYGPPAAGKPTAGTPRPPARGAPGSEWVVLFGSSR